jgi:hypothetical protein
MFAVRSFFCMYLLIRVAEAGELGNVMYRETHNPVISVALSFVFIFALTIVVYGVRTVGQLVALTWHCVLELILVLLSEYWAANCAFSAAVNSQSLFSSWTPLHRFILFSVLFLFVQGLLAMAGAHIIVWMIKEQQQRCLNEENGRQPNSRRSTIHSDKMIQNYGALSRIRKQAGEVWQEVETGRACGLILIFVFFATLLVAFGVLTRH